MNEKEALFVTRELPSQVMEHLAKEFSITTNPYDHQLSKSELITFLKDIKPKWIVTLLTDPIDKDVISSAPLKGIAQYAVGFDNIDIKFAQSQGITVTNTPGVLTETTADLTWALMLSVARRIPEADQYCRNSKFTGWAPLLMLGSDIYGKTLGIIGMGKIGQAVARRAIGFDMKVIYFNKSRKYDLEEKFGYQYATFESLIKESDFISLHIPYSPSVHKLIGLKEFSMMKRTAYIINTARGKHIDEDALANALITKQIAGAGLDVYYNEPVIHAKLLSLPNIVLAPHIGSSSLETRTKMGLMVVDNLCAMKNGKIPPNVVSIT